MSTIYRRRKRSFFSLQVKEEPITIDEKKNFSYGNKRK